MKIFKLMRSSRKSNMFKFVTWSSSNQITNTQILQIF